jgi:hypothetical protein
VVININKNLDYNAKMKGARAMHLGAFRTDKERF